MPCRCPGEGRGLGAPSESGGGRRNRSACWPRERDGENRKTVPAWIDATQYDGVFAVSEALCRALWMLKEDASYWHRAPSLTEKADTD